MEIIKKYKWLPIVVLAVLAGVFFFFCRFYHKDTKALTGFSGNYSITCGIASYEKFDKAISDFFISRTDDLDNKAGDALIELNIKATFRLSSLIKNDAELMDQALKVANLSGRGLDSLRIYKGAIQSKNAALDGLAKEYGDLTNKRKFAYARFQKLAGLKD